MVQIFKSLLRHRTSLVFNLIGLSTAFAVVIVIAITVQWENSFDKFHPDHERLYRFEFGNSMRVKTTIQQPLAEVIVENNALVEQAVFENFWAEENVIATISVADHKTSYDIQTASFTPNFFTDFLDFNVVAGDITAINNYDNVIICESLAQTMFGDSNKAIGQSLTIGNTGEYIIGAVYSDLPENSIFENRVYYRFDEKKNAGKWNNYATKLYVKLVPNADPESFPEITLDILEEKGVIEKEDREAFVLKLRPINEVYFTGGVNGDTMRKGSEAVVQTLAIVAIMILIISLINFSNFYFAAASTKMHATAIRRIMGQTKLGAFRHIILEALVLFVICFVVAVLAVDQYNILTDSPVNLWGNTDIILMIFIVIMIIGSFLSFLYAKYIVVGNVSFSNIIQKSKKRGLGSTLLVVFQFFISCTLIAVSLYMICQMNYIDNKDVGYDKEDILKFNITSTMGYNYEPIRNELLKISQVKEVAFSMDNFGEEDYYGSLGREYKRVQIGYDVIIVSPTFLDVMNIKIVDGSNFIPSDSGETDKEVQMSYVFNKKAQDLYELVPGDSVSGNLIRGVSENFNVMSLRKDIKPTAFAVFHKNTMWSPMKNAYCKLHSGINEQVKAEINEAIAKFDPSLNVEFTTLEIALDDTYKKENSTTMTIMMFSLISIMLSLMGVIGQIYYEILGRVREISIRKVYGSTVKEILGLFLRKILIMATVAFGLSLPVSYFAITLWSQNFAYSTDVNPLIFVLTYLIVSALVVGLVVTVCWKSATQNPTNALK